MKGTIESARLHKRTGSFSLFPRLAEPLLFLITSVYVPGTKYAGMLLLLLLLWLSLLQQILLYLVPGMSHTGVRSKADTSV